MQTIRLEGATFRIPVVAGEPEGASRLYQRSFKSDLLDMLSEQFSTNLFIDVGANVGQTLLEVMALNRQTKYLGFEPNPEAFYHLSRVHSVNGFGGTLFPWACSATAAPVRLFHLGGTDSSGTMNPGIRPDLYSGKGVWIAAYPLDFVLGEAVLSAGFVMKIDVEGAELDVLKGARDTIMRYRPAIICEVLHAYRVEDIPGNDEHKRELETFLRGVDYSSYAIRTDNAQRLKSLEPLKQLPRGAVWRSAPHTCDFLFLPSEISFPAS